MKKPFFAFIVLIIILSLSACQSKKEIIERQYYEGYRNLFPTFDSCVPDAYLSQKREILSTASYFYDYVLENTSTSAAKAKIDNYIRILEEYGLTVSVDYELDDATIWGVYTENERIGRFSVEEAGNDVKIIVHPFDNAEPIS